MTYQISFDTSSVEQQPNKNTATFQASQVFRVTTEDIGSFSLMVSFLQKADISKALATKADKQSIFKSNIFHALAPTDPFGVEGARDHRVQSDVPTFPARSFKRPGFYGEAGVSITSRLETMVNNQESLGLKYSAVENIDDKHSVESFDPAPSGFYTSRNLGNSMTNQDLFRSSEKPMLQMPRNSIFKNYPEDHARNIRRKASFRLSIDGMADLTGSAGNEFQTPSSFGKASGHIQPSRKPSLTQPFVQEKIPEEKTETDDHVISPPAFEDGSQA